MKELTIDNNKIVSIDAISKMKKLEKLSAANNNIADIKAIANCRNLSYINFLQSKLQNLVDTLQKLWYPVLGGAVDVSADSDF